MHKQNCQSTNNTKKTIDCQLRDRQISFSENFSKTNQINFHNFSLYNLKFLYLMTWNLSEMEQIRSFGKSYLKILFKHILKHTVIKSMGLLDALQ